MHSPCSHSGEREEKGCHREKKCDITVPSSSNYPPSSITHQIQVVPHPALRIQHCPAPAREEKQSPPTPAPKLQHRHYETTICQPNQPPYASHSGSSIPKRFRTTPIAPRFSCTIPTRPMLPFRLVQNENTSMSAQPKEAKNVLVFEAEEPHSE